MAPLEAALVQGFTRFCPASPTNGRPSRDDATSPITVDMCPSGQVTDRAVTCPPAVTSRVVRNLWLLCRTTSLITMWPHSLLFSSDEEASRALSLAFTDLEFEVETCPEIFSAVEKITRRSFDVVVSDWNEGLEAVFLLKTVRELKANHSAFTIAIANADAAAAALAAGADLVLGRPLLPDKVKYALLTCDPFLVQMRSWLPRNEPSSGQDVAANRAQTQPVPVLESKSPENLEHEVEESTSADGRAPHPLPRLRAWPSPPPPRRTESVSPVVAAESIF
jgi:CheY-like chemotaxis protein